MQVGRCRIISISASPISNAGGAALYTLEAHIRYVAEVRAPAQLEIETIILGADAKRIWFAHLMMVDSRLRATCEYIGLHYDTRQQCAAPLRGGNLARAVGGAGCNAAGLGRAQCEYDAAQVKGSGAAK